MHRSTFRFYEELNDFLPPHSRKKDIEYIFHGHPAVKDAIESLGIPHSEVYFILVNGDSVGFEYQLNDGDRISVFPVFETLDISNITKIHRDQPRQMKFILDVHLGKLSRYLRFLGFDSLYSNSYSDREIISISVKTDRIILTRDSGMLKHSTVKRGYYVRSTEPKQQILEVVNRFGLKGQISLFSRCPACNGVLKDIDKHRVEHRLPDRTKKCYSSFKMCSKCGKIYWNGGHVKGIIRMFKELGLI